MVELAPWQTAWPAGALAALVAASAAVTLRGARPRWVGAASALGGLALLVRLVVLPALGRHEYDGHEAEYWDIFRGVRPLSRGGTVLYPAMQWLWAGLGALLPHHEAVPVLLMVLIGVGGVLLYAAALARRVGPEAGLALGLALAVHPVVSAWSSSAYNVILPWALLALCFAALERAQRPGFGGAAPWLLAASSAGLALLCRLDAVAGLGLPLAVVLEGELRAGRGAAALLRRWAGGLALLAPCVLLVGLGAYPLVVPGGVPGEGERLLSFQSNLWFFAPYAALRSPLSATGLVAAASLGLRRAPWLSSGALVAAALGHLLLATFDDFADRHAIFVLPALLVPAALAWGERGRRGRWAAGLAWAALLAGLAGELRDTRSRFYGSEEAMAAALTTEAPWSGLPRWSGPAAAPPGCAWISEAGRFSAWSGARSPPLSQFNLLAPDEAAGLRGASGCMLLVLDLQDWRWSSRGVRDRSLRMSHLYVLQPVALVSEAGAGYPWGVAVDVGARRCCDAWGRAEGDPGQAPATNTGGWSAGTGVLP